MTGRRRPPVSRPWSPLQRGVATAPPGSAAAALPGVAADREVWLNDRYVVLVERRADGSASCLSVRRTDRKAVRDWRHLQQIKNELAGPVAEAVELYPAESRLVDTANQTWLWCLPPGEQVSVGFRERLVLDPREARAAGAVQRPRADCGGDGLPGSPAA